MLLPSVKYKSQKVKQLFDAYIYENYDLGVKARGRAISIISIPFLTSQRK
jgi:hypothetical protein